MTRFYPSAASVIWAGLTFVATWWAVSAAVFHGFEHEWWMLVWVALISVLIIPAFVSVRSRAASTSPVLPVQPFIRIHSGVVVTLGAALTALPIVFSALAATSWTVFGTGLASAFILSAFLFSGNKTLIRSSKISLLLVASVVILQWPLRISFLTVVPRLEKIAAAVRAGEKVQTPVRVGVFTIKKLDSRPNARPGNDPIICLWLTPESGNPSVLAQCGPSELMFNVSAHTILSSRWQFVTED